MPAPDKRQSTDFFCQHSFRDAEMQIDLLLRDHGHEDADLSGWQST